MCDICDKKFQEKASLWLHRGQYHPNNSNDQKDNQKEIKFKKGYPQNLRDIEEPNLFDFECNQCDKKFKKKGFLERHISIIHETEITKPEKRYKFEFLDGKVRRSQLFTNKNKGKLRGISRKCGRRRSSLKVKFFGNKDVDMIKDITETYYENGERASDKVNAATRILNNMLKIPESGPLVIPKPTGIGDTVDTFDKVCGYNLEDNKPQDKGMR